ncbi:MAG: ATP-binding protein [Pedobacter sp.]|jgi:signal transduction histidine kinase/FixJ family two-component response regulator
MKGKIIVSFVIACTALFLAWGTSKIAFREMLSTVKDISNPNEKLSKVNDLYRGISNLEQVHSEMVVRRRDDYQDTLFNRLKYLNNSMDTLSSWYQNDPRQISRILALRKLLLKREQLFLDYLRVRDSMVSNEGVSVKLRSINGLITNSSKSSDTTTMLITEKKTYTSFYSPEKDEVPNGLLAKIFGKKKKVQESLPGRVTNEEMKVKVDTISYEKEDSLITKVQQQVRDLETEQRRKSANFVNNQTQLANSGSVLTIQMLGILEKVEHDLVTQVAQSNSHARSVVNRSLSRINIIIIICFVITAVLLGFILTDISKRNKYRKELEIARDDAEYHSAAKQRFLSNMSHEIRTPLQAIIGFSEQTLKQGIPKKQDIEAIHNSSGHLLQIVNEVLDYSRIISGKFSFKNSIFNLRALLDEVVSVMRMQATQKSLDLVTDYQMMPSVYLMGDPFRLKQILYNLLNNAVKFTSKGKITLSVSCKEHREEMHITFRVQDTGRGISYESQKHIFNEFEQETGIYPDENTGTGLGLSIVNSLTVAQGGRIYVQSEPEKGSCFTLYLKYPIADRTEEAEAGFPVLSRNDFNGKVWIVDDDKFILQLCSDIFAEHNISHCSFGSPQELLNTKWDPEVTCILVDLRMPGMNGQELRSILKKNIPEKVRICALTAQALPAEQESILQGGFDSLLMKPFTENELLAMIYGNVIPDGSADDKPFRLTLLQKMTLGDKDLLNKILARFLEDSTIDGQEFYQAHAEGQIEELKLLSHRIAGRLAQIGGTELAASFRKLELILRESAVLDDKISAEIKRLLMDLGRLNDFVRGKVLSKELSETV